jgi:NAD(P)H-nitrite reductase large subunit
MKTFIFFTSDQWKGTNSGSSQFLFKENQKARVLKHIQTNLADYFEGNNKEREQKFKEFRKLVNFKNSIVDAINTDLNLFARCEEIKFVTRINPIN